jgi:tricorn protease
MFVEVPVRVSFCAVAVVLPFLSLPLSFNAMAQSKPAPRPSLSQPAISPDGREIAFVSGSDIWTVPASGGEAHLLVSDPAEESRPLYSPDGTKLAFMSTRTGGGDIYVLTLTTGQLQRITYSDSPSNLDAWSRDGEWLYFTSTATDVGGNGDILRVRATGGTPMEVSHERYMNEFESAPSPDGKQVALVAKGISSSQWWRNGHAHIDETEIWLKPVEGEGGYRKLISADAKHAWPMWSADGKQLLFMGDKAGDGGPGHENLYEADAASGAMKELTHFSNGRVLWPTISYDGKTVVFERNFGIWKADAATGKAEEVKIVLRGLPSGPGVMHEAVTAWSGLALSPDGKKIAVAGQGEIFAAAAKEGGEAQRLTHTEAEEFDPRWTSDSMKVIYRSERDGGSSLYEYDFTTNVEKALTHGKALDTSALPSPDGKLVAFIRDRKELHVLTLASGQDKVVATGEINEYQADSIAWSPDSKWVAYVPTGFDAFTNIWVVPADGSAATREITFLANGENASRLAWSPDGKYILFDTSQRTETPQLARVDLIPHVPQFREDQFRDLFRKQVVPGAPDSPASPNEHEPGSPDPAADGAGGGQEPAAQMPDAGDKKQGSGKPAKPVEPVKIVFEGIRERLTLLPLGNLGVRYPVISPDGKTLAFLADAAGQQNIYTYSLDELAREPASPRELTSDTGSKSDIAWTPDSKEIYYLQTAGARGGAAAGPGASGVRVVTLATRTPRPVALAASLDVDFDQEKLVVFDEAWSTLDHRFFRGDFNGADWTALKAEWTPYVEGARTGGELRRDINLLIGELDSSHSGISKPSAPSVRTGRLGVRFERAAYEHGGALVIREIVPLGPMAIEGSVHVGDRILAVNGTAVGAGVNLDQLLEDAAGRRVMLSVASGADAAKKRDVVVRPVTLQVESGLLYRAWVESRRAYVDKISDGKLGYVHIEAMGDADLAQLYVDLDVLNQAKKGVIVDVRNNNGGYVNGRVIDVFARKNYLIGTPRDGSEAPMRQALGQRALGLPTVLVTNESTLSDGEDFTEGYRTLELGKTVGTPTAGWIIFTGAQRLIDGSSVRVPGDRIRDTRGQDMEMHPRPVDVEVVRGLGETETGEDVQLEKAVQTLLGEMK